MRIDVTDAERPVALAQGTVTIKAPGAPDPRRDVGPRPQSASRKRASAIERLADVVLDGSGDIC